MSRLDRSEYVSENGSWLQVRDLGEKLAAFERANRVRAVALKNASLHGIKFEVEVEDYADFPEALWDAMQDLVIDSEWQLREETQEEWYFHLSCGHSFSKLESGSRLVWCSAGPLYHQNIQMISPQAVQVSITKFKQAS